MTKSRQNEFYFKTSNFSHVYSTFFTSNNVLSTSIKDIPEAANNRICNELLAAMDPYSCADYVQIGAQDDPDHPSFHFNKTLEDCHAHFYKGRGTFEDFTPDEIICMLKNLKDFEAGYGLCKDGKSHCFLSDADRDKMIAEYEKHYRSKSDADHQAPRKTGTTLLSYEMTYVRWIKGAIIPALQTTGLLFVTTMIDHYIKPMLITKGYSPKHAYETAEAAKIAVRAMMTLSFKGLGIEFLIRHGLLFAMKQMGVSNAQQDKINSTLYKVGIIAQLSANPFSFTSLYINSTYAAGAGIGAAYALIRLLPKLRLEPEPRPPVAPIATNTLRKR